MGLRIKPGITMLVVSLLINIAFIYKMRYSILDKLTPLKIVSADDLKELDNVKMPLFIDTVNKNTGPVYKILVVGNSLAYCGIDKANGWEHNGGVAATSIQNDYAHLLFKMVENKYPGRKVELRVTNLADFERGLVNYNLSRLDTLVSYKADVIIFQLGENVETAGDNIKSFERSYTRLINYFKAGSPLIICTTPFFPSFDKNQAITNAALNTKSYLIDLSNLSSLSNDNLASGEKGYKGDRSKWRLAGMGIHPGDTGMYNISKLIFTVINAH